MAIAAEVAIILGDIAEIAAEAGSIAQGVQAVERLLSPPGGQQLAQMIQAGFALVQAHLADVDEEILLLQRSINDLGNPQQALKPVTLPALPPAAWNDASASAIWTFDFGVPLPNAGGLLLEAGGFIYQNRANLFVPKYDAWPFAIYQDWTGLAIAERGFTAPVLSIAAATLGNTLLQECAAQNSSNSWFWQNAIGGPVGTVDEFNPGVNWRTIIDDPTWQYIVRQQRGLSPLPPSSTPSPVWPGLSRVVLGSPVAISPSDSGLTVAGPMAGVIVAITTVPSPIGYYGFDGDRSYIHIGAITFTDDNGQDEEARPLGFAANVICPKAMALASAAKLRLRTGTSGTVTPWTFAAT